MTWPAVVLTEDPEKGTRRVVPIREAMRIADARFGRTGRRSLPRRNPDREWAGYQLAVSYFERDYHLRMTARLVGIPVWKAKKYRRRFDAERNPDQNRHG